MEKKIAGRSAVKGNRVDCLPKDIQKDMLAQTPERANSPLKMGKGSRRLRSPKREKTEADKRKSVNSLREVLKNWQPGASLDAHEYESSQRVPLPASQILPHAQQEQAEEEHEENPDVDIELQKEIRAMEKRLELKMQGFLKEAVVEACKMIFEEAQKRDEQERLEAQHIIQTMIHTESQAILDKVQRAMELSVRNAVSSAIQRHGVPTKDKIQGTEETQQQNVESGQAT